MFGGEVSASGLIAILVLMLKFCLFRDLLFGFPLDFELLDLYLVLFYCLIRLASLVSR